MYDRVKVISATMAKDRAVLGERATEYLRAQLKKGRRLVDTVVTQSSDHAFHCVAITMFFKDPS